MADVAAVSAGETTRVPGLVSAIVPVYASNLLAKAVHSIFQQTFRELEVIVVNDGSPDPARVEAAIAPYRERICYVAQSNAGPGAARNAGLRNARGEFVAFLDADDRWLPTFVAEQMALVERSRADLAYCDALIVGCTPRAGRRFMELSPSREPVTLDDLLTQRSNVILSGVVARRAPIDAVGGFDPSLRRGQDFDLWLRMAAGGSRLVFQRKVLVERYECSSGLPDERIADLDRLLAVLSKTAQTMKLPPPSRTALAARIDWAESQREIECAKRAIARGRFDDALDHLERTRDRSAKVQIARAALKVAPRLTRGAYVGWRAWLDRRARRRQLLSSSFPSESAST